MQSNRFELYSLLSISAAIIRNGKRNLKIWFNVLLFVQHWSVSDGLVKIRWRTWKFRALASKETEKEVDFCQDWNKKKELLHDCCLNTRQYIALVPQFNGKSTSTVASGFQVSIVPFLSQLTEVSQDSSGSKERRMLLSCKHRVLLSLHNLKHSVKTSIGLA